MDVKILDGHIRVDLGIFAFMSSDVDSYYLLSAVFHDVCKSTSEATCFALVSFFFLFTFVLF